MQGIFDITELTEFPNLPRYSMAATEKHCECHNAGVDAGAQSEVTFQAPAPARVATIGRHLGTGSPPSTLQSKGIAYIILGFFSLFFLPALCPRLAPQVPSTLTLPDQLD